MIMAGHADTIANLYAAFARGDILTVLSSFSPDITWTEAEGFPYAGTFVGPVAVVQNVFAKLGFDWDGFAVALHELVADNETVVALGECSGTYRATGKSVKAPFAHVWKFDAGRIRTFRQHIDTAVIQHALR